MATDEETRRRRADRQDRARATVQEAGAGEGPDWGEPNESDIDYLRRQAKKNPANQNPDRTSPAGDDAELETRRQRAHRVLTTDVPHTPTRAQVTSTARTATGGAMRLAAGKAPKTAAGFVMGFLLYAAGLNLLRNGPAGVWDWVKAKFVNETPGTKTPGGSTPSSALTTSTSSSSTTSTNAVQTALASTPAGAPAQGATLT